MWSCAHEPVWRYFSEVVAQAIKGLLQVGVEAAKLFVHVQYVTILPVEDKGEVLGSVADEGQL